MSPPLYLTAYLTLVRDVPFQSVFPTRTAAPLSSSQVASLPSVRVRVFQMAYSVLETFRSLRMLLLPREMVCGAATTQLPPIYTFRCCHVTGIVSQIQPSFRHEAFGILFQCVFQYKRTYQNPASYLAKGL